LSLVSERKISVRRACRIANIDHKSYHYQPKLPETNKLISDKLKSLSDKYPRYGFRKLFGLLRASGMIYNHKRVHRIYVDMGLNIKIKPKKRLTSRTKQHLSQPGSLNKCWSLDYMSDALDYGRCFRTANVIDDCNREGLGILASLSLPATRITRWLDQIAECRSAYPDAIRVDNGPENISKHFQAWAKEHGIQILYIQPGKPAQNGYIERFNRSYREAVLDMYLFKNIAEVQEYSDEWLSHYNQERPHEALGNVSPWQYATNLGQDFSICA
jgi:putative transposase